MGHVSRPSGDSSEDPGETETKLDTGFSNCGELSCSDGMRSTLAAQQDAQTSPRRVSVGSRLVKTKRKRHIALNNPYFLLDEEMKQQIYYAFVLIVTRCYQDTI